MLVTSILLLLNGSIGKDWNISFLSTHAGSNSGGNFAHARSGGSHFDLVSFLRVGEMDE
jgi:hypothetical protein